MGEKTIREYLDEAKKTILNCHACAECNGLACGNTFPGPGSKAPGLGAHENWKAWKEIRLNFDTFVEHGPIDTTFDFFGHECSLPLLGAPLGTVTQYSKEDVTPQFNHSMMETAKITGTIECFGDAMNLEVTEAAKKSLTELSAPAFPMINPLPDETILERIALFEDSGSLATGIVLDTMGLGPLKGFGKFFESKTVAQLRELKKATKKPFVLKSIMTAKGAEQAVEAGADAIVVSNHGGRTLPDCAATATVLPEIVRAVDKQAMILVDGGIRHGVDMVKALALGADAVMILRPYVPMWFGGGTEGMVAFVEQLREEFESAMYLVGARSLADLNPDMVRLP